MRLYPTVPRRRNRTVAADAAAILAVIVFAWLGVKVHDRIDELAGLGRGVHDAGASVQRGFDTAADATGAAPVFGGPLSGALRDAGRASGGNAARLGTEGEASAHEAANLLGWLTFLIPTGLLLQRVVPGRVRQVRTLTDAERVLQPAADPARRRLVAMRAAFALPYGTLLRYTRDPLGDLEQGRYDPLVAAALEDAGLGVAGPGTVPRTGDGHH